jgi:hypothetical protein
MGGAIMIKTAIGVLISLLPYGIFADEPLAPLSTYSVRSLNGKYLAKIDAEDRITSIFRINSKGNVKIWEMYGVFRWACISNDGKYIAIPYSGANLLPENFRKDEIMVLIVNEGKVEMAVKLNQIIDNFNSLTKTVSHYLRGTFKGFNNNNQYIIETVENKRVSINYLTKEINKEELPTK